MLKHGKDIKKAQQLDALENHYRWLVKQNPASTNATREHLNNVEKCVRDMKRIRGIRHSEMGWLQEIINRKPAT